MRNLVPLLAVFTFLTASAYAQEPMRLPAHPEPLTALTADSQETFSIEVAREPEERARGLMFREEMPDDRGMLFVFEDSRRRSFWMQNTPMPLDLLFIDADGTVQAIEQGEPFSTDGIAPPVEAQFVLELKAGTAQKAGIEVGTRLRHPLLDAAAAGE